VYPRTVLVVEDTAPCATTLEIALAQIEGLDVRVVSSAEDARRILDADADVCALVTDVHLPEASGLDLIRWVRSRHASARLPIVVISGDTDPDTPATILKLGADAFFAKPFSPSEVRHKLEDLIDAKPPAQSVQ
jgi:DNA-binding response OmpR family regulator